MNVISEAPTPSHHSWVTGQERRAGSTGEGRAATGSHGPSGWHCDFTSRPWEGREKLREVCFLVWVFFFGGGGRWITRFPFHKEDGKEPQWTLGATAVTQVTRQVGDNKIGRSGWRGDTFWRNQWRLGLGKNIGTTEKYKTKMQL